MEYSIQCTCIKIQQQLKVLKLTGNTELIPQKHNQYYILVLKSSYKHAYIYRSWVNTFSMKLIYTCKYPPISEQEQTDWNPQSIRGHDRQHITSMLSKQYEMPTIHCSCTLRD